MEKKQKIVVIGAGPVGSLAALYAANRGDDVEIYELRSGESFSQSISVSRSGCIALSLLFFYFSFVVGIIY